LQNINVTSYVAKCGSRKRARFDFDAVSSSILTFLFNSSIFAVHCLFPLTPIEQLEVELAVLKVVHLAQVLPRPRHSHHLLHLEVGRRQNRMQRGKTRDAIHQFSRIILNSDS
jgi:hypothetical protein